MKTVEMPIDNFFNPIPVTGVKTAIDYVNPENIIPIPEMCIVRILAMEDVRIWNYTNDGDISGDGVFLLDQTVEYFSLLPGYLKISGKANVMFYKKNN